MSADPHHSRFPETPAQLTSREVLRSRDVRAMLVYGTCLYTGLMLQAAVLGKQVYDITGREIDIGWIGLVEFLPAAVLVLVTGVVADRFYRRNVVLIAVTGELVSAVALMFYARTNPTAVAPIFLITLLYGVSRAFVAPAARSIWPSIAPPGGLPAVVALSSATWTGAAIAGPAMSGFLYSIDPWVAYFVASVLIAMGMAAILRVNVPRNIAASPDRPTFRHAIEGLVFIRRTPILLAAISLDLFAVLFGGAVALLPVIAEERLGVGDVAYGWLRAAVGIGAAAMAVFLAWRPVRRRVGQKLFVVVATFGVMTVVLGLTHSYVVAFIAILVLSAADMVSVFIRSSIVPLVTPDEKRGRVLAVENVFIGASNELGAFESGVASQAVGTAGAVVGGGIATVGIAGLWWLLFPALRRVDRFSDLEERDGK
ncbi:MAG: MFS transporter [Actinobacteria bacterium]|nr:MFS transporter [Actinomycetota bacterium]